MVFKKIAKERLHPLTPVKEGAKSFYPEMVHQALDEFLNGKDGLLQHLSFEGDDTVAKEQAQRIVKEAAIELVRRVYHFTHLLTVLTTQTNKSGNPVRAQTIKSARNTVLWQLMLEKYNEEYDALTPEEKKNAKTYIGTPRERWKKQLDNRFHTAWQKILDGTYFGLGDTVTKIPGLGDTAYLARAIENEFKNRDSSSGKQNVFNNLSPNNNPSFTFFWEILAHMDEQERMKDIRHLKIHSTIPAPEILIQRQKPKEWGKLEQHLGPIQTALLNTRMLLQEEGLIADSCVGKFDIFSRAEKGPIQGAYKTYIFSVYNPAEPRNFNELPAKLFPEILPTDFIYHPISSRRKHIWTVEIDAEGQSLRQVEAYSNNPEDKTDFHSIKFQVLILALQDIFNEMEKRHCPIRKVNTSIFNPAFIDRNKSALLITGEQKHYTDINPEDIILTAQEIDIPPTIDKEVFLRLTKHAQLSLRITSIVSEAPDLLSKVSAFFGNIILGQLDTKTDLKDITVHGNLSYIAFYKSPSRVILPKLVYGDAKLTLTNIENGITLPEIINGNLNIRGMKKDTDITMPKVVHGSVKIAKGAADYIDLSKTKIHGTILYK